MYKKFYFFYTSLYKQIVAVSVFLFFCSINARSQKTVHISNNQGQYLKAENIGIYQDNKSESIKNIRSLPFTISEKDIPIFTDIQPTYWIRLIVQNETVRPLYLHVQHSNISSIILYSINTKDSNGYALTEKSGSFFPFHSRKNASCNFVFNLPHTLQHGCDTFILKIKSKHPLLLPLFISNKEKIDAITANDNLIIGIYMGIMLAIFLYNLFLFFFTKDTGYVVYIFYVFFLCLAQLSISGYPFKYFWPNMPRFNDYTLMVFSALAGISGIYFSRHFLQIKLHYPIINRILIFVTVIYFVAIVLFGFNFYTIAYNILNLNAILGSILLFISGLLIAYFKGFKSAYYYMIAWIFFLSGIIVFALRNFSVLPYNNFTTYFAYLGSAVEGILLSIALADKINILQKTAQKAQKEALERAIENEQLVVKQNSELEEKVKERTQQLRATNENLQTALNDLKDAQIQLVEAEKMASLGQLTAGIAHEINNPINFVKSNIKPLQLDVQDIFEIIESYHQLHQTPSAEWEKQLQSVKKIEQQLDVDFLKIEITNLMKGIEEGAERTAEIVRGLRTFSRLDESEVKTVNIHEGIDSTLIILRNATSTNIQIIKNFGAEGIIECYPGKLNQVFMNIISNALHAVKMYDEKKDEFITITTKDLPGNKIEISIKDSGPGMTPEIKSKIFDPFFTTKDVGEGTGLGLAIVFKIIQKHGGTIQVHSTPGNGAEFVITLYHSLPKEAKD